MPKMTQKECYDYWKNPSETNLPERYLDNESTRLRTLYLQKKIRSAIRKKSSSILELGCNVGRNLNALHELGYTNLAGVELNQEALALMSDNYPALYNTAFLKNSTIEDYLRNCSDKCYDVIVSLATLMHIHPDSESVFDDIRRVAQRAIITIEYENNMGGYAINRIWKRNYQDIFEGKSWKQTQTESIGEQCDSSMIYYTYRLFRRLS